MSSLPIIIPETTNAEPCMINVSVLIVWTFDHGVETCIQLVLSVQGSKETSIPTCPVVAHIACP